MDRIAEQEFRLSDKVIWLSRFGVLFFVCMAILSLALPFLPDDKGARNEEAMYVISGVLFLIFCGFSAWGISTLRYLPFCNITIDNDGLWYSHLAKEIGLVEWESIFRIKEKPIMQRLDLIGGNGERLMRVEYQLIDFEYLRSLLSQTILKARQSTFVPATFSAGMLTHYSSIAVMAGFCVLGWYVGSRGNHPLLGYGGMTIVVGLILHEYLTAAWKLELFENHVVIRYPLSSIKFSYDEIESIELADMFHKGVRHPEVVVKIHSGKQIRLQKLNIDAIELHAILQQAAQHGSGN